MSRTITHSDFSVKYEHNAETFEKVFNYLMKHFFTKYECYNGETIVQCDEPQMHAAEVLAEIADDIFECINE